MPKIRPPNESPPGRFIYIACPWTPVGGGMYKVADYLIQSQHSEGDSSARLRPLDTRGGSHAALSLGVLAVALMKILWGRLGGRLAGVHVNMGERLSLLRKSIVVIFCRALGVPVVLHLHAQMHPFYRGLAAPLRAATRWVFSLPASVLVIGATARRFVTEELGVPGERVEVIQNGVPGPAAPRRGTCSNGVRRILFVGRLCQAKGVPDLLDALARPGFGASHLDVVLAGPGDLAAHAQEVAARGLSDVVRLAGWCNQHEVATLMANADVLVLPSHDEVLPLVILEALAHGAAVVCTPVGEIPSVLTDGVNACFVAPGDVDGLAATLQRVLNQPGLLDALGRNGRTLYEQQFSLPRFCASIARVHHRHFGVSGQSAQSTTIAQEPAR